MSTCKCFSFSLYLIVEPQFQESKGSAADLNKERKSFISQCTKTGENGEIITVAISTEESHQATILGINISAKCPT